MLRPEDTSPEAWAVYLTMLRQLSVGQSIAMISDWYDFTRALAFAGLRQRHPDASEVEIGQMFLAQILDRKSMA